MGTYYDERQRDFDRAQQSYENQEPEDHFCEGCRYFDDEGMCVLGYCVEAAEEDFY